MIYATYGVGNLGALFLFVNDIALPAKRAEVTSSYQIACFAGNALPVVGVGVLAEQFSAKVAIEALAIVVASLAAMALILDLSRADGKSLGARR